MEVLELIRNHIERSESVTEQPLPRSVPSQRQIRVLQPCQLIIRNFPLESKSSHLLYTYPYLGQFKNLVAIRQTDFALANKRMCMTIEFSAPLSSSLALLVSSKVYHKHATRR